MTSAHPYTGSGHGANDDAGLLQLAGTTAVAVVDALDLVAELPSTPRPVAEAAQDAARGLSQRIAAAGRAPTEVEVSTRGVVSAAGILSLVGVMPSTPPTVAADASARAAELWDLLDDGGRAPGPHAESV